MPDQSAGDSLDAELLTKQLLPDIWNSDFQLTTIFLFFLSVCHPELF